MIYIAENIKSLRKSMGLTQDEVAEMLGVTPQSVSKWERGDTYPDITLLPALANFFRTSVDALLGMEKIHDAQARNTIFKTGHEYLRSGDYTAAAAVYEEVLKTFPNDESLMSELALALSLEKDTNKLRKAVWLCERVLAGTPTEKVRHTTRAVLCFVYMKIGDIDRAVVAAHNLPHMRESREAILAQLEKEASQIEIDAYIRFIALGEENAQDVICVDFGHEMLTVVDHNLVGEIGALRDELGHRYLPPVRVCDNAALSGKQVRLRYYADYVLDKEFLDARQAVAEIPALRDIVKKRKDQI